MKPKPNRLKILVITGASGGHIFPATGFLDTLKDKHKDIEILLVLPKRNIAYPMPKYRHAEDILQKDTTFGIRTFDCKVNYISISPIKLGLDFKNVVTILKFIRGSWQSLFIILKFKPDIVVGFGSLTCVPMVLFARILAIKTIIHEQNVIPGRANRFSGKFADRIAISFIETKDYFKDFPRKIVLTGNPIRRELKRYDRNEALDFFGFSNNRVTILVMGGSLGSHRINIEFLKTISKISDSERLQIVHLTGIKDYGLLKQRYRTFNLCVRLFSFLESMQYAYSAADLVLSRGGATTISEIIFFGLPAIIVPYPYAYKHQLSNAKTLESKNCAIIIEDNQLHTHIFKQTIDELINNTDRLKSMRSHYDSISRLNANDLLVDEVLS